MTEGWIAPARVAVRGWGGKGQGTAAEESNGGDQHSGMTRGGGVDERGRI